jgi:hypothetical protein
MFQSIPSGIFQVGGVEYTSPEDAAVYLEAGDSIMTAFFLFRYINFSVFPKMKNVRKICLYYYNGSK